MGHNLAFSQTITTEVCYKCGVCFGMPEELRRQCLDSGRDFYCPNGHAQHYTDSTEKKLARANDEIVRQRQLRNEAEAREQKVVKTMQRLRKRVKNGICPCCHRSFRQLAAHMKCKHPNYGADLKVEK